MLVICCFTLSCGDDRPSADPIPIRGGERLRWTQRSPRVEALREHRFTLYVDGSPSTLLGPSCLDTFESGGYECSGGLPPMSAGMHVLELTSTREGVESPKSPRLYVTLSTAAQAPASMAPVSTSAREPSTNGSAICTSGSALGECFDVQTIASGLGSVEVLASTPDRRLLISEGSGRLLAVADRVLLPDPVLILPDPRSRVVGLAVDPRFAESRTVFVAWTEPARDDGILLNVTRYRAIGNTLGDAATIAGGFPFAADSLAPLAVDREGLLYIALPRGAVASVGGALPAAFGGAVLRVDRDGLTPIANRRPSPVLSYGYAEPTLLAVDGTHRRIWLGGNFAANEPVSSFDLRDGQAWPILPARADLSPFTHASPDATALAFDPMEGSTSALLSVNNQLFLTRSTSDARLAAVEELPFPLGVPIALASAPNGSWYVAVRSDRGTTDILLLQRRQ